MAINLNVRDLLNYPDVSKTITIDLKSVIPTGAGGDEKYVLSSSTTATASGSAAIQESFISDAKVGWVKSNTRINSPFSVTSSNNQLKVAVDEGIASAATITLEPSAGSLTGETIAADMENKIKGLTVVGGDKAGNLSYLNAKCYYQNGRFIIVSGSASSKLTGSGRSSVSVAAADTNDASETLGFDVSFDSATLAGQDSVETYVSSDVSSNTTVPCGSVVGISAGDCVGFKLADGSSYYRYVDSVSSPNITVNTNITVPENTVIQVLRFRDPEGFVTSFYTDVDAMMRHSIERVARQINYAS